MKQLDELLIQDLAARLNYGVILYCKSNNEGIHHVGKMIDFKINLPYAPTIWIIDRDKKLPCEFKPTYDTVKPFLRPMSLMPNKDEKKYRSLQTLNSLNGKTWYSDNYKSIDWLNKHYYDYRDLIKKRLAYIAPEGMYED